MSDGDWYCPDCSEWSFPGLSELKAYQECFAVEGEPHRWVRRDLPKPGLTYPGRDAEENQRKNLQRILARTLDSYRRLL